MSRYKNYLQREAEGNKTRRTTDNRTEEEKQEAKEAKRVRRAERIAARRAAELLNDERAFNELNGLSDAEIAQMIEERKEQLGIDNYKRIKSMRNNGYELSADDAKKYKEIEMLENFPRVREKIIRIMDLRNDLINQKKAIKMKIGEGQEVEIDSLREELDNIKKAIEENEKRYVEIQQEMSELNSKEELTEEEEAILEKDAVEAQKLMNNKRKLKKNKSKIEVEIEELESRENANKRKAKALLDRESKYDMMIRKCNTAWRALLAGKSWDEIFELVEVEKVVKKQARENIGTQEQVQTAEQEETTQEQVQTAEQEETSQEQVQTVEQEETPQELDPETAGIIRQTVESVEEVNKSGENLPDKVDYKKFEDKNRFTNFISRLPFVGKKIANKFNERAERIARTQANLTNKAQGYKGSDAKTEAQKTLSQEQGKTEEPQTPQQAQTAQQEAPAVETSEAETPLKVKRDAFTTYLKEIAENGHTEQGKYITDEQIREENRKKLEEKKAREEAFFKRAKTQNHNER